MRKANIRVVKAGVILGIVLCIMTASAQGAIFKNNVTLVEKSDNKAWTTLFYIDDDYSGSFADPLEEVFIDEISSGENVNVVVIQDTLDGPVFLYYIDENHTKILLEELGELNMADYQVLRDFIDYGKQNYPADRYLLWVYDHGGAWKGACLDETSNAPAMSMDDIQKALAETGGVDVICFLACLMGSLESVYELRDLVDIYIGSEDLAYGSWWDGICGDTNQLLTDNPEVSSEEVGVEIVNFFEEHSNPPADILTMSAVRTDKVEPLVDALNDLARYFVFHWFRSYGNVKAAYDDTFLLADYESWAEVFEVYDLKDFVQNLPASSEKDAVLAAFDEAVVAEVHGEDMTETHGLSIFFQSKISQYRLFREYKSANLQLDLPMDTLWNEFLFFFILTNTILRR